MALTDREKKLIKSKFNKFKQVIKDTGAPPKKVLEVMESTFLPLNEIYKSYDKQKDKFKGGVPGAVDKFFEKEMKQANKFIKETKRASQDKKYDKKTDYFTRKGPRGDRSKKYSNNVRIVVEE